MEDGFVKTFMSDFGLKIYPTKSVCIIKKDFSDYLYKVKDSEIKRSELIDRLKRNTLIRNKWIFCTSLTVWILFVLCLLVGMIYAVTPVLWSRSSAQLIGILIGEIGVVLIISGVYKLDKWICRDIFWIKVKHRNKIY